MEIDKATLRTLCIAAHVMTLRARAVVNAWESGDLAGAVRKLADQIDDLDDARKTVSELYARDKS